MCLESHGGHIDKKDKFSLSNQLSCRKFNNDNHPNYNIKLTQWLRDKLQLRGHQGEAYYKGIIST